MADPLSLEEIEATFGTEASPKKAFTYTSIISYAPDGKTVIGEIFWLICPMCHAMVSPPDKEQGAFPDEDHVQWHRDLASSAYGLTQRG